MLSELYELDSSNGWVPYFQKINWMAKENAGHQKIAKLPENRLFNRYRDVLPYDHSRVVLKEGETDYINANLVEVPSVNKRYILTQGPLKNTSLHFWQMVWEQNSQAIIMLNRVIEKNQIKCHQYWPCGEKVGHTNVLEFGWFRITYIEENMNEFFTVRTLEIFNMKEEEKRNIFHFHYLHWPDFGVPSSPATFLSFLLEVRNAGLLSPDVGPSIIHCSAGIGRSGTFIMVDSKLKEVEQTQDLNAIDVKTALLEIRRYRVGLIQTPDQLRFTYAAILEGTRLLMPQLYEEALEKFSNERAHEEEEEEVSEEDEVPPPVPVRKRQEVDQTVDKEANIAPKRKRSLPDVPTESTSSAAAETPKETSVAATADISKGVSSYQGFQADNISSDESDGEDEIIDLSESSSSSSSLAGEESEEDRERLYSKEDLTPEQDDQRHSEESGEQEQEEEEGTIETEISHKTEEEDVKMEENEELQAEIEVQEDLEPEVSPEGKTFPIEKEYKIAAETTIPRKEMNSWMVEREEMQDKLEDKKELATKTEETANTGNAKDTEVRKEREKTIDAGKSRAVRKEIESRMDEPEDFYDRLGDREFFAKTTAETIWQGKAKDTEVRKEREKKIDVGKSRAVITEMENRIDEPEDFDDSIEDKEEFAKTTEETTWQGKAKDKEAWKKREKKMDEGVSRAVITEMENRIDEPELFDDRLGDREELAKTTAETTLQSKAKDTEVRKEKEKKIGEGVSRAVITEMENRIDEPELFDDRLGDREELAKTTAETTWQSKAKDTEVRKKREKKIDVGKSRAVITEMENRIDEPEDFYDRLEDKEEFAKTTAETTLQGKAKDTEVRKEREKKIGEGVSRAVRRGMESRMDETEDFQAGLQDREVIGKTTEETTWQGKAEDTEVRKEREKTLDAGVSRTVRRDTESRMDETEGFGEVKQGKAKDTEVRKEREKKIDVGKSRAVITEMENRIDEPEDFDDSIEDKEEFAKTTEETTWQGKAKDKEAWKKREKKMDEGVSRAVITEMENRIDEPELFDDRLGDREELAKTTAETTLQSKAKDTEVRKEKEKKIGEGVSRAVITEMENRIDEPELFDDRLGDREELAKTTAETTWQSKAKDTEVRKKREKKIDVGKSRAVITEMENRIDEPEDFYDRLEDKEEFAKTTAETTLQGKAKDTEVRKEREKKIGEGVSRAVRRGMESRMDETEDFQAGLQDREVIGKTTEETTWQGKAEDTEVRKEREKTLDAGVSRTVRRDTESRMDETEGFGDRLESREDFTETIIKKFPAMIETGERMHRIEREKANEIAIQTSIPFMVEDFKIDIDKEQLSSEDRETEEERLLCKESICIQAGTLDTEYIEVVIDSEGDRKMEGKKKPSNLDNLFQEETLIGKENIKRITEKEEVKEVISSAIETQSSVEQESGFKRQAFVLDKSENVVKTEDNPSKPLIEGGINLTGPALVLEKMNDIKIPNCVASKPVPEPMESGSDIMESGHGAYARITKAEKIMRSRDEPSNESIGGSIGTNPRKSDPEIQSKKIESDKKSPDNLQPSTSKESETELRRRQRQEKKEKTEKLVKDIKARVEHEENTRWIRKIIRNSLIVIGICATAYIAYRCYRYFSHIPRRKPRRF